MTVAELIAELKKVKDDSATVTLIVRGAEAESFTVSDYSTEDNSFVALED